MTIYAIGTASRVCSEPIHEKSTHFIQAPSLSPNILSDRFKPKYQCQHLLRVEQELNSNLKQHPVLQEDNSQRPFLTRVDSPASSASCPGAINRESLIMAIVCLSEAYTVLSSQGWTPQRHRRVAQQLDSIHEDLSPSKDKTGLTQDSFD